MFDGMPEASIRGLMGFKKSENRPELPVVTYVQDVPATFDARTQWPNCASIGTIRMYKSGEWVEGSETRVNLCNRKPS